MKEIEIKPNDNYWLGKPIANIKSEWLRSYFIPEFIGEGLMLGTQWEYGGSYENLHHMGIGGWHEYEGERFDVLYDDYGNEINLDYLDGMDVFERIEWMKKAPYSPKHFLNFKIKLPDWGMSKKSVHKYFIPKYIGFSFMIGTIFFYDGSSCEKFFSIFENWELFLGRD